MIRQARFCEGLSTALGVSSHPTAGSRLHFCPANHGRSGSRIRVELHRRASAGICSIGALNYARQERVLLPRFLDASKQAVVSRR